MGRLVRHRSRKIPKVSRTTPVYGDPDRGDGLDAGVLFRCWYCGMHNNTRKQALGDANSSAGIVYEDFADNPDYGETTGIGVLGGIANSFIAQQNGSDGNPIGVKNAFKCSDSGTGCSFCGSKNYAGFHP